MVVGLSCVFLLVIAALLLRFGIPRADLPTLANTKWFALGLSVMFAFLTLFALADMGGAAARRDARRITKRADIATLSPGTFVIVDTRISSSMARSDKGWVAYKSLGSTTGDTPPLVVELADGPLKLAGSAYVDVDWPIDEQETYVFLEREQPVTVFGKVVTDPESTIFVEQVLDGARTDGIQKKARIDFLMAAAGGIAALLASPGIAILLLVAARRRRRELTA